MRLWLPEATLKTPRAHPPEYTYYLYLSELLNQDFNVFFFYILPEFVRSNLQNMDQAGHPNFIFYSSLQIKLKLFQINSLTYILTDQWDFYLIEHSCFPFITKNSRYKNWYCSREIIKFIMIKLKPQR